VSAWRGEWKLWKRAAIEASEGAMLLRETGRRYLSARDHSAARRGDPLRLLDYDRLSSRRGRPRGACCPLVSAREVSKDAREPRQTGFGSQRCPVANSPRSDRPTQAGAASPADYESAAFRANGHSCRAGRRRSRRRSVDDRARDRHPSAGPTCGSGRTSQGGAPRRQPLIVRGGGGRI
jgi:hypothetical protein